jgi:FlaA1/EpsC-like NDP-sugar epimerase
MAAEIKTKQRPLIRNRYLLLADLVLIAVSVLASFVLRLNLGARLADFQFQILTMIGIGLLIKPLVYYLAGLYHRVWTYASIQELKLIAIAVTCSSILIFAVLSIIQAFGVFREFSRSVLPIDWLLSLIFVGGVRFSLRIFAESRVSSKGAQALTKKVLVVGAGDAGALVVREMQKNPQLNLLPVGFLDDDPAKQKNQIYGVKVVGKLADLRHALDTRHVDEVIIAIPSAGGREVRMVADICRLKGSPFRTMPGLYELIGGKVSVNRLREVDITDLLRREPAQIQSELVGEALTGKRVLVTGAGGSIGRELCRQITRWNPSELVLFGHGENSIFEALLELRENYPALQFSPLIGDVRDLPRLQSVFKLHQPQMVFHAAAHKHVPLMESNVEEAVTNNIIGTRNVVQVAKEQGVERLVMISTDKAIRPANVMGATKRVAEMIVLQAAQRSGQAFSVVRFGNVLGSRGSVVPLFKQQIAHGGPVTVTHPEMKRYFMTIPEAVHLVLQAAAMGRGGEVFLLNMGQQVRILDLAEDLIRLSGLEPHRDIEITFTGIRPGEKLSEDLWEDGKNYGQTAHPDVFRVEEEEANLPSALDKTVEKLYKLANEGKPQPILDTLGELIPSAAIHIEPMDITSVL